MCMIENWDSDYSPAVRTTTAYLVEWQWEDGPRSGWTGIGDGQCDSLAEAKKFVARTMQIPSFRPWRIVKRTYTDEVVETHDGATNG